MANVTDPLAQPLHGTNPQNLLEYITRQKIYDSLYWKEECFGLSAVDIVEKAATQLQTIGGSYGPNNKPTRFLCLICKMLQIQPEEGIIEELLDNEDFKYVRLLGAFYLRLTGRPAEIYEKLEVLYNDYRKVRIREVNGWRCSFVDEFVEDLLKEERVCGIALPRLPKREVLVENGYLEGKRVSALSSLLNLGDEDDCEDDEANRRKREREAVEQALVRLAKDGNEAAKEALIARGISTEKDKYNNGEKEEGLMKEEGTNEEIVKEKEDRHEQHGDGDRNNRRSRSRSRSRSWGRHDSDRRRRHRYDNDDNDNRRPRWRDDDDDDDYNKRRHHRRYDDYNVDRKRHHHHRDRDFDYDRHDDDYDDRKWHDHCRRYDDEDDRYYREKEEERYSRKDDYKRHRHHRHRHSHKDHGDDKDRRRRYRHDEEDHHDKDEDYERRRDKKKKDKKKDTSASSSRSKNYGSLFKKNSDKHKEEEEDAKEKRRKRKESSSRKEEEKEELNMTKEKDKEETTGGGGDNKESVEYWNEERAKLGLKPLR